MHICVSISSEAKLGHVMSGPCCTIQTTNLQMVVMKVFIVMLVSDFEMFSHMFNTKPDMVILRRGSNPPYPIVNTGALITIPFCTYTFLIRKRV